MEESTTAEIPTLCWNDKGEKSTLQIYFQNVDFSIFITCSVYLTPEIFLTPRLSGLDIV